jgi:asparagine synthase (glutamine-hydrolysing)
LNVNQRDWTTVEEVCGLVAAVSRKRDIREVDLAKMLSLAEHRGPDGQGLVFSDGKSWGVRPGESIQVGLGHVRLSILDPSDASSQPFVSACGRYAMVFNGEIYNFTELRRELALLGHDVSSSGDTEVLFNSLIEWSEDALIRIRGMFSFVFVDLIERSMLAARDRYGIKPLYMWSTDSTIHFASEIKQFTCHPSWRAELSAKSAIEYLLYGVTDYSNATCFRDVHHVQPGSLIKIDLDSPEKPQTFTWWKPIRGLFTGSYADATERYRDLLGQSLQLHLQADVSIASCLSGGLDSSAIVGMISKMHSFDVGSHYTFTAISEDSRIDESKFARAVNEYSGTLGCEVLPTAERLWSEYDKLVWHQDEPFSSSSIYAQWCVFAEMSRSGIKVALDGQGADEQLGGYNSFISLSVASLVLRGKSLSAYRQFRAFNNSKRVGLRSVLSTALYSQLPKTFSSSIGRIAGVPSQNPRSWINSDAVKKAEIGDPFAPRGRYPRSVQELRYDMVDRINLPMLLRFEDRNSMAFGVEARVPFVDHELMEFALSLPQEYLLRDGQTKSILRASVSECIPSLVASRRDKIGFQTSEKSWLKNNSSLVIADFDHLRDRAGALFTDSTREMLVNSLSNERSNGQTAWRIHNFLRWMSVFDVNN